MAVNNWINYAAIPAQKPIISDLLANVLKGYQMEREPTKIKQEEVMREFMNQIRGTEAKYSEPMAQESLKGSKLTNQGKQQALQKAIYDAALDRMINNAVGGNASPGAGMVTEGGGRGYIDPQKAGTGESNYSNQGSVPGGMSQMTSFGADPSESDKGMNPNGFDIPALNQNQRQNESAVQAEEPQQRMPETKRLASNEQQISEGNPNLYHIDKMYDENPLSRALLEKKGLKKTETTKIDSKSGSVTQVTKYPSGRTVVKQLTAGSPQDPNFVPLEKSEMASHQKVVSAIDNMMPLLAELSEMPHPERFVGNLFNPTSGAAYKAKTATLVDSVMAAFKLPSQKEALELAKQIVSKGTNESEQGYQDRIYNFMKELGDRRSYSTGAITRGIDIRNKETPKVPESVQTKKQFQSWLSKLNPHQRYLVKLSSEENK